MLTGKAKKEVIKKYNPPIFGETKQEAMKRLGITDDWGIFYNPIDYAYYPTKNYTNRAKKTNKFMKSEIKRIDNKIKTFGCVKE